MSTYSGDADHDLVASAQSPVACVQSSVASAQSFYTRWARAYDVLARYAPGVGSLRRHAVDALDPDPGDVVLDLGCGTGANFPYLREAVGAEGTVVGVDFAPGPVTIARDRAGEWENVHVLRGDAARPPVFESSERSPEALDSGASLAAPDSGERSPAALGAGGRSPDAVLASFVVGMLSNPGDIVRSWAAHVGPGGRLALLDLARTGEAPWRALNPLFGVLTRASAPGSSTQRDDAVAVLDRRVEAAHEALTACCVDLQRSTHVGGFARISAGRVEEDS